MASTHPKRFEVDLFFPGSLFESDVHQEVSAFTELFAVQQVMQAAGVEQARVVYVVASNGQVFWFYEVQLVNSQLRYSWKVKGSVVCSSSAKLTV